LEIRPLVGTYYVLSIGGIKKEGRKEGKRKKENHENFIHKSIAKTESMKDKSFSFHQIFSFF
jgi:hypothetical protein